MKKIMKGLSIFILLIMVLGACAPQAQPEPSVDEPEEVVVDVEEPEVMDTYSIAVIRWDPNDIYFNGVQLGQEMERDRIMAEEGVEIEFRVFGANDAAEQVNALQTYMDVGIDGALVVPWTPAALTGSVQELNNRGIPVVAHNSAIPGAKSTLVAFDNYGAGVIAGQHALERLNVLRGEDWVDGEGVVIVLRCIITLTADIGRYEGYKSVFGPIVDANPNLQWEVDEAFCDGAEARGFVGDMITRYGPENILAVLSIDGTMGIGGAVPAFDANGILFPPDDPNHIPVVTVDGTQVELEGINRGYMDFAAVQPAIGEGIISMRVLWEMIKEGRQFDRPETESVYVDGDELWMPVQILPGEGFDGPWYKLQTYGIPTKATVDDVRIWSNIMFELETGQFPEYVGPYGK